MIMQATDDYPAARAMAEKLGVTHSPVQAILNELKDVPVGVEPRT